MGGRTSIQTEGDIIKIRKMKNLIGSFISGLGKKDAIDINNAIFIATRLQYFDLTINFKGAGLRGVESFDLYGILPEIELNQDNLEIYYKGKIFSDLDSYELKIIASYLWNNGSSLKKEEKIKASQMLQSYFEMPIKMQDKFSEEASVTASG